MTAVADTHCPYCALQCGMRLTLERSGVQVEPRQFPTNGGGLCRKGWTSAQVLTASDRLTDPLVRGTDGELHPTTWGAALDLVAARLREIQDRHGNDAVAVFGGGGLTNEKAYALGKFARAVLRTRGCDPCGSATRPSAGTSR